MLSSAAGPRGLLRAIGREHRWIVRLALAYIVGGGLVSLALRRPWPLALLNSWFAGAWFLVTASWLAGQWLRDPRRAPQSVDPVRVGGALLVFLLAVPTQITFQALKQSIGPTVGFRYDPVLAQLDEALHRGPAWHMFAGLLRSPSALRSIDWLYMFWFLALVLVIVWLSWTGRRALRARALLSFLLIWIFGGTIAAWALASAGPCYSDAPQYRELIARLDDVGFPLWARFNQRGIWAAQQADQWLAFGGVSAMPSMHVAVAVWMAVVVWHRSRRLGALLTVYACIVQIGSVVLGWHYAIDGYIGAAIAWFAWSASDRLTHSDTLWRS